MTKRKFKLSYRGWHLCLPCNRLRLDPQHCILSPGPAKGESWVQSLVCPLATAPPPKKRRKKDHLGLGFVLILFVVEPDPNTFETWPLQHWVIILALWNVMSLTLNQTSCREGKDPISRSTFRKDQSGSCVLGTQLCGGACALAFVKFWSWSPAPHKEVSHHLIKLLVNYFQEIWKDVITLSLVAWEDGQITKTCFVCVDLRVYL